MMKEVVIALSQNIHKNRRQNKKIDKKISPTLLWKEKGTT